MCSDSQPHAVFWLIHAGDSFSPCCVFGSSKFNPPLDLVGRAKDQKRRDLEDACEPRFIQIQDRNISDMVNDEHSDLDEADRQEIVHDTLLKNFRKKTVLLIWLWCVPGMIFCMAWISLLQYMQHFIAEAGNRQNINVSQYAVMISNVGGVVVEDDRLKDFGRYYGATCCHSYAVQGSLLPARQHL